MLASVIASPAGDRGRLDISKVEISQLHEPRIQGTCGCLDRYDGSFGKIDRQVGHERYVSRRWRGSAAADKRNPLRHLECDATSVPSAIGFWCDLTIVL